MHRSLLALAVAGALTVAACSSGDDSQADTAGNPATAGQTDTADQNSSGDPTEQQPLLGVTLSGPPGTVIEFSSIPVYQGEEQSPVDLVFTIDDQEERFLFSPFIESAVVTFEVTEGGPATVSTITGVAVDPENPFAGVEVISTFETTDAVLGEPVELSMP